jgi:hypothetical protein
MTKAAELAKMGDVITNGQIGGRRNALINGQMQCWQRGTAFSGIANGLTYTADRWVAFVAAGAAQAQVNQDTSVPEGFRYSLEFGRASGETDEVFQYVCQLLETQDSLQFANKKVTFSFYAKAGANFSAASSLITVKVSTGTGTDESSATFSGGPAAGFTGNAVIVNATQAITTTWTRYTFTGTVSASATQIAVAIGYDPVGTAGADDNFYITGCQLEEGSQATPFEHRSFGEEFDLCLRYYEKSSAYGEAEDSTAGPNIYGVVGMAGSASSVGNNDAAMIHWQKPKRATPTLVFYDAAGNSGKLSYAEAGVGRVDNIAIRSSNIGVNRSRIGTAGASSLDAGEAVEMLFQYTADSEL